MGAVVAMLHSMAKPLAVVTAIKTMDHLSLG